MESRKQNTQESQENLGTSEGMFDRDSKGNDEQEIDFFQTQYEAQNRSFKSRSNTLKDNKMISGGGNGQFELHQDSTARIIIDPYAADDSIKLGQNHQSFGNPQLG